MVEIRVAVDKRHRRARAHAAACGALLAVRDLLRWLTLLRGGGPASASDWSVTSELMARRMRTGEFARRDEVKLDADQELIGLGASASEGASRMPFGRSSREAERRPPTAPAAAPGRRGKAHRLVGKLRLARDLRSVSIATCWWVLQR